MKKETKKAEQQQEQPVDFPKITPGEGGGEPQLTVGEGLQGDGKGSKKSKALKNFKTLFSGVT